MDISMWSPRLVQAVVDSRRLILKKEYSGLIVWTVWIELMWFSL
jgi:hypothetical protein